jgi:hypothetical protein
MQARSPWKVVGKIDERVQVLLEYYESELKILEAPWKILEAKCQIIKYQKSWNK